MRILYDLYSTQSSSDGYYTGGGEYGKIVFLKICEYNTNINISIEVFYNPKKHIEELIINTINKKNITVNFCKNNDEIIKLLCDKKYDVFYSPLPYSFNNILIPSETKFIYTIHGLRALEYPIDKYELKYKKIGLKERIKFYTIMRFQFLWKWYKSKTQKVIKRFDKLLSLTKNQTIITVSNHTKYSIAYFIKNIDISQIKVFYSPLKKYEFDSSENTDVLKSYSVEPNKYILLIGGNRREKGAYRACRVLYNLMNDHSEIPDDIKILVLGVSYYKPYHQVTHNSKRFKFHGYVSTEELETLYKNAFLFLYPTLNEGFGYPPLEAMKYGTFCAVSANSAITEVYGDSVLYFNPHDEIEMGIRILQSFDEDIRKEKHKKMPDRCQMIMKKQEKDLELLVQTIIHEENKTQL